MVSYFQKLLPLMLVFFFILPFFWGALAVHAQPTRLCTPGDESAECVSGGAGATTNAPLPGTTVRECTPGDENCTPGQTTSQPLPGVNNGSGYQPSGAPTANFVPLTGIPGVTNTGDLTFGGYVNALFRLLIGIAALLAVIKIILAGIKYMGSEGFSSKGEAKEDIQNALLGLLIILSTVIILYTINPDILKLRLATDLVYVPPYTEEPETETSCGGSSGTVCECTLEALKTVGCSLASSQTGDFQAQCEKDDYGYLERQPSGTWQCIPNTSPPPTTTVPGEIVDTVIKNYLCGAGVSCLVFDPSVTDEETAETACAENSFDSGLESAQGPASNPGLYYYCK